MTIQALSSPGGQKDMASQAALREDTGRLRSSVDSIREMGGAGELGLCRSGRAGVSEQACFPYPCQFIHLPEPNALK